MIVTRQGVISEAKARWNPLGLRIVEFNYERRNQ